VSEAVKINIVRHDQDCKTEVKNGEKDMVRRCPHRKLQITRKHGYYPVYWSDLDPVNDWKEYWLAFKALGGWQAWLKR
jgi:hypothetical protein